MSPALAVTGTGKFGWAYPLASGDFDFITSASGTAVSSLSINNCFSADYDHYLVMRSLLGNLGNQQLNVRLRASSTDATTGYRYQTLQADSTSVAGGRSTSTTSFSTALGYAEALGGAGFSTLWISNPFGAVRTTAWANQSNAIDGSIVAYSWVYEHDTASSYDGLTVIPGAGTITGSIYVYGLAV